MKLDETHLAEGSAPVQSESAHHARAEQHKKKPRNRRARGTAPASRAGKTSVKRSNGHPRVNGHGRASSPAAAPRATDGQSNAASVDAGGASAAIAAASAAAGTDRTAYAEAAHAPNGKERLRPARRGGHAEAEPQPRVPGDAVSSGAQEERRRRPGPGEFPLPDDIADFVDEIHSRVDLFEVLVDLVTSEDEKVKQRALEKILEMKYGRSAESGEEPVQIIMNGPRPQRD